MLKRVLLFDVNRILMWDVGRALNYPIPPTCLKWIKGYLGAAIALDMMNAAPGARMIVAAGFAGALIIPDLIRSQSTSRTNL